MSYLAHPLPGHFELAEQIAFVGRTWRRLRWRHVGLALGTGLALAVCNNIGTWVRFVCIDETGRLLAAPLIDLYLGFILGALLLLLTGLVADEVAAQSKRQLSPYVIAIAVSALVCFPLCQLIEGWLGVHTFAWYSAQFGGHHGEVEGPLWQVSNQLLQFGFVTFIFVHQRDAARRLGVLHAAQLERARLERQTIESRLQVMQARVEPEFLFNTLSQVEQLYEIDLPRADRMLDDLIVYLRAALPLLRESSSTLAKEVRLIRAYLDILRVRHADRLRYRLDVADSSDDAAVPPMVLLPLVDRIVGIATDDASQDEICLIVGIAVEAESLKIDLTRTSSAPSPQIVVDLVPVQARLTALYGAAATLAFDSQIVAGATTARVAVSIPHERPDRRHR